MFKFNSDSVSLNNNISFKYNKMKFRNIMIVMLIMLSFVGSVFAADAYDTAFIDVKLLNQDPDPVEAGEYLELRFKVVKEGNQEIENLAFTLDAQYPFRFDETDVNVKSVGDWIGNSDDKEYYTLYYKIWVDEEAKEGTYDMDLYWKYNNIEVDKKYEFDVRVDEEQKPELKLGDVSSDPIKLLPDTDENKLSVEILNIGDEAAENVQVTLNVPKGMEATYSYSNRETLGNIEAHSSKVASFYLNIEDYVDEGNYPTSLYVEYKEEEEDVFKNISIPLNIEVKSKPTFEVLSYEFDSEKLEIGKSAKMRVQIKNIGSKKAESVSVRAYKESSQPFEFDEKNSYVGTLEPGEIGEALISFDVEKDGIPKKYILDLEIRSVYNEQVFVQDEEASFDVVKEQGKVGSGSFYFYAGVVVLIVLVAFFVFKKKK